MFAEAATLRGEPQWLEAARKIRGYLRDFLTSPEGAFYVSQDADLVDGEHAGEYFALDDAGRRARGIPRVDRHLYARENGLAITGSGRGSTRRTETNKVLADVRRAAECVLAQSDAGWRWVSRHDERDAAGPYLADTLDMGRAFLALYAVTGERIWLTRAEDAARFIDARFRGTIGFSTAVAMAGASFTPKPQVDENIALARCHLESAGSITPGGDYCPENGGTCDAFPRFAGGGGAAGIWNERDSPGRSRIAQRAGTFHGRWAQGRSGGAGPLQRDLARSAALLANRMAGSKRRTAGAR